MRPRQKLRNGSWIIPSTGERTRRQFTLRNVNNDGSADDGDMCAVWDQPNTRERLRAVGHNVRVAACNIWTWLQSPKGRGTLKCSIAYFLGSMGTFFPPFARFLGPMDGKHIVATITVYFHPARTAGSQIEAVVIAVIAVLYALLIGTMSMATSVVVGSWWQQISLAYALILIVFVFGGMGFIGWVKQKLNNPLVSVGASIASIGIITIVTKENSVHTGVFTNHKIIQSLKILVMASTISTAVNLLLFRESARCDLRNCMRKSSVSLGDMLSTVTRGFLSGAEEDLSSHGFTKASATYSSTLTVMNKNLKEAKYEYYFLGREDIYKHDKAVVRCMETLAQALGGLSSAADTQLELLKEKANGGSGSPNVGPASPGKPKRGSRAAKLFAIDEGPSGMETSPDRAMPFKTPSDMFEVFIARLGPSLKSLVHTLSEILKEPPFNAPGSPITINENFKQSVEDALSLFNTTRAKALGDLYKTIELERARPEHIEADFEEVAAACGHFSFSLMNLGDEMKIYLDALDDLKHATEVNKRSWSFLRCWKYINLRSKKALDDPEQQNLLQPQPVKRLRRSALPRGIPDNMKNRRDSFNWDAAPQASRVLRAMSQKILKFLRVLTRDDIRFGLKVGMGAMLYAMFAFIPQTRPIYQHWRGEWGLLSFMIVCSMTVGASNTTAWARFTGTLLGAAFVIFNWWVSNGNAVVLAFLGWLVSLGTFYIMIDRGNAPFGRFIILTYNVSSLYAYSLSQTAEGDDDDEGGLHPIIRTITYHRVIAVSIGILWGLIICRVIWPISARAKFKEGLCVLYLQMGLIWKRGPLAILLRSNATESYIKIGEQEAMQRYASQLQTLRAAAANEYRLRGPFPTEAYGCVMVSTQRLLDAFHAMSLVTQKHGQLSSGEKALLYHTAAERAELCTRICHVFQVIASSVMLEYPLGEGIPSVDGTRDRLLGKIFRFRKEHNAGLAEAVANGEAGRKGGIRINSSTFKPQGNGNGSGNGNDKDQYESEGEDARSSMFGAMSKVPRLGNVVVEEPDYALLYAYALVTSQVAKELRVVEKEVEALFGRLDDDAMLLQ